ncbi:hypothetical protein LLEC1_04645 [Akanthomyces lecanii]|uniref:DNA2/NAM7 helicase-like C-terminal domain-containing protein n=1 Tax=Cordyceps confragosa TaxID=2714763 RepID=A0A179IKH5_CORDF|nr:hypothetical protein LLEC1_04645 [Akanthomyces lecanii]
MPGGHTIAELLAEREFRILLVLPVERTIQKYGYGDLPAFKYPNPHDLTWDTEEYQIIEREHRSQPWITPFAWWFVGSFVDALWIREIKIPAHFAILDSARQRVHDVKTFYVILAPKKPQLDNFEAAWRGTVATYVAIDEPANMRISDLLSGWGNCALPCALAGDTQQLPPAVFAKTEMYPEGSFVNRFADAGKVSLLLYFMTMGLPYTGSTSSFAWAAGLFDTISRIIYPEVPLSYAKGCEIAQPRFKICRDLGAFLRSKLPALRPPPPGKLLPVFVHCDGCPTSTADPATWSLRNPAQVRAALDLTVEFVKVGHVDTKLITFIAPYTANVDEITTTLKKPS